MDQLFIDLSQYNVVTNLAEAVKHCDGIYIRLGIRGYSAGNLKLDNVFQERVQQLIKTGKPWGIYFCQQAITEQEAIEEALFCIKYLMNLDKTNMTLGVFSDSEYADQKNRKGRGDVISKSRRTAYINAFCSKLYLSGYKHTGVYCSEDWAKNMIEINQIQYLKWIARYGKNNGKPDIKPTVKCDIWQFTSKGTIPSIKGYVDLNYAFEKKQNPPEISNQYYPAYMGKHKSISSALAEMGINSTYTFRKKLATENNIANYTGTVKQNIYMFDLLRAGKLIRN